MSIREFSYTALAMAVSLYGSMLFSAWWMA